MNSSLLKTVAKGVLSTLCCWLLSLLIFCFCSIRMADPQKFLAVFANVSLLLGAFIGGRVCSKNAERRGFVGLCTGIVNMLIVLAISLIISDWSGYSLLFAALTVLFTFFGASLRGSDEKKTPRAAKLRKNITKKYGVYQK